MEIFCKKIQFSFKEKVKTSENYCYLKCFQLESYAYMSDANN